MRIVNAETLTPHGLELVFSALSKTNEFCYLPGTCYARASGIAGACCRYVVENELCFKESAFVSAFLVDMENHLG